MSKIFKDGGSRKLFKDYIPEKIIARDEQINHLNTSVISSLNKNGVGMDTLAFGYKGTGKTCTIRHLFNEFKINNPLKYKVIWVNCQESPTPTQCFFNILNEFKMPLETDQGTIKYVKMWRNIYRYKMYIKQALRGRGLNLLVVFDQIDDLLSNYSDPDKKGRVLSFFLRPPEDLNITTVMISNDKDIESLIPRDLRDQYSQLLFPTYSEEEHFKILKYYADKYLRDGVWDEKDLRKIADWVGGFTKNIRFSKMALGFAGKITESNGHGVISGNVPKAFRKTRKHMKVKSITTLPEHEQLVLLAVLKMCRKRRGDIKSPMRRKLNRPPIEIKFNGILRTYKRLVSELGPNLVRKDTYSERVVYNMLNELREMRLVKATPSTKGHRGRFLEYETNVPDDLITEALDKSGVLKKG